MLESIVSVLPSDWLSLSGWPRLGWFGIPSVSELMIYGLLTKCEPFLRVYGPRWSRGP